MSLQDLLKAETERLGFPLYGTAPVAPPPHLNVYERWLDSGLHAEMAYLAADRARERRAKPDLILPEASALLVVALRYFDPLSAPDGPTGEALGRVAAYAWGDDYHDVIPPRLAELVTLIEKYLGRPVLARSYTDTGPILERDFAQQAGLGWSGKNTCFIHPRRGSYFLLGESLLDVPLEPDHPFLTDHCGTCRRCIETCPTQCIREDRTIDSGRCISYLTIENKGTIPPDLRPKIGEWVFGCDICQIVCPWNVRFASSAGDPSTAPREGVPRPLLRKEIHLTPQEFNRKFRRSPIQRSRRRGYLRNLAVALGNQPDPAAIPDLAHVLENEPEPLVRAHVAWALGRMQTIRARRALEKAHRSEPEPGVRVEIDSALQ
jgi:epoxyqueuosine reductase